MLVDIFSLTVALVLLTRGGSMFVGAAVRTAAFMRMPRAVIGSTIVSLATTTPEFVVSVVAAARGNAGLAIGNAIGSCVCNIGLILGITAIIQRVHVDLRSVGTALWTMLGMGALLFLLVLDLELQLWQALLLIVAGAVYFVYDFVHTARHHAGNSADSGAEASTGETWLSTRSGTFVQFIVGAAIVVLASHVLVDSTVKLAVALGIPQLVIGLTIVAVGTSLPEVVTAIGSARRKVPDLAVGNILGANISNLCIVVGASAMLTPIRISRASYLFNFPAMLALMSVLAWALWTERGLTRRAGAVLLVSYAAYVAGLVLLTASGQI